VRIVLEEARDAASMVAAAGLDWRVEQHPLEAVVEREYQALRVRVPRHVANVRSDTRVVLGVVGEGTSRSRTRPPSPSATPSLTRGVPTGSGRD
jgi:hypothetical protein